MVNNNIKKINSFVISLAINAQFIAYIMNIYFGISGGITTFIYIMALFILILYLIITKTKLNKLSKINIITFIYILAFFLYSFLITSGKYTEQYFTEFIGLGILALLIAQFGLEAKNLLTYNMFWGLLFCLNSNKYISSSLLNISYERASMFTSYLLVPIIISTLLYFSFYRKESGTFEKILYVANAYLFWKVFFILGRGPLLCIIVSLILLFYYKTNFKTNKIKKTIILLISIILLLSIITNFTTILNYIYKFLLKFDIEVAAIRKCIDLINEEGMIGLLNNRNDVWTNAFNLILNKPFLGNGIGQYGNIYNTWPHNLFLQLLVEFGIIFSLPIIIIILKNIYTTLFVKKELNDEIFMIMIFSISIPRLMISTYLWHNIEFWIFFFYIMNYRKINK